MSYSTHGVKYIGSKAALLDEIHSFISTQLPSAAARTIIDVFTGTTRVAQSFRAAGWTVTSSDLSWASEAYAHAFEGSYGLRSAVLRFANVYGAYSTRKGSIVAHLFRQILEREPITIYGDGSQERDFVFVDDLCDGIIQAMDAQASGIFHLGSGKPTTLADLLDKVGRIVGPDWPLDIRYAPWRMGEVRRTHTRIAKAVEVFGYSPATGLESGLEATWRWFTGQYRQGAGDQ